MSIRNHIYRIQLLLSIWFSLFFSEIPHPDDPGFGMTFHFYSGEGRVGDSLSESPTLPLVLPKILSFRALARNLPPLYKICL